MGVDFYPSWNFARWLGCEDRRGRKSIIFGIKSMEGEEDETNGKELSGMSWSRGLSGRNRCRGIVEAREKLAQEAVLGF